MNLMETIEADDRSVPPMLQPTLIGWITSDASGVLAGCSVDRTSSAPCGREVDKDEAHVADRRERADARALVALRVRVVHLEDVDAAQLRQAPTPPVEARPRMTTWGVGSARMASSISTVRTAMAVARRRSRTRAKRAWMPRAALSDRTRSTFVRASSGKRLIAIGSENRGTRVRPSATARPMHTSSAVLLSCPGCTPF